MTIQALRIEAEEVRKTVLKMIYYGKGGHTGGDFSSADIMTALYQEILHIDPDHPDAPDRDRFVLSKGHCVETYYAVLSRRGFFPKEQLESYGRFGTELTGHPNNHIPGIEMNTGALGHGLSIGVGMAIGLKRKGNPRRVYVLMGDGEQAEGSVWEAYMAGAFYQLDNLIAILDRNHLQISGNTEDVMKLEPLAEKYRSFGWDVVEIDGNDMQQIVDTLQQPNKKGVPRLVIAHTIKGKGVKEMENVAKWHHGVPDAALFASAMSQLEETEKEIQDEGR
jgi:transketolase